MPSGKQFLNLENAEFVGAGYYGIPKLESILTLKPPDKWVEFDYAKRNQHRANAGVHFFEPDYKFERIWNFPNKYPELLSQYAYVLSPDFSMYRDAPRAMQIWNHYRKHWCGAYWQHLGINVIPTIGWVDKESYDWCFDGEPECSIVAVSNVGCRKDKETRELFLQGYKEMLIRLQPKEILFFGRYEYDYPGNVRYIPWTLYKGEQSNDEEEQDSKEG